MTYTLVLDIGGTKIAGAVVNKKAQILNYQETSTLAKKSNKIILDNLINFIYEIKGKKKINKIAAGIAGHIDYKKGTIIQSPNFNKKFKNINIKKILEQEFKTKTFIDNDVNCFALGEAIYGLGKKYKKIIGITLGTGVGGGVVINKKLYHGKNNLAGEIGMISEDLSVCLFNVIHAFDPDIIIVGGGLSNKPNVIKKARQKLNNKLYYQAFKNTVIIKSKLQNKANLLGAYSLTT